LSKLVHSKISPEKVIIGEYRVDLEKDKQAEENLTAEFVDIDILTTIEGRKLVPIQDVLNMLERIKKEKDELSRKKYDEGYKKGHADGLAKGHAEAQEVIDNFNGLINDAVNQREILFDEAHQKILELVIQIARKITFDAAQIDPDVTAGIIAGTIEKLVDKSSIKVKVHPDHLPLIEQQIDRFKGGSTAIKQMTIEPDRRVRYGGCFIETPTGDIDARVDSQMEIIAGELEQGEESDE